MGIFSKINTLFRSKNTQASIDEFEDILLESGLSPTLTYQTMDLLNARLKGAPNTDSIIEMISSILGKYILEYEPPISDNKTVFLFVGVNGVGKTTSIAKYAYYLMHTHNISADNLVMSAGDTFRAGAIEQLQKHADALNIHIIKQQAGADPAAVLFDTLNYANAKHIPYIIADTAGRMHNRKDLIAQLQKIYRVLQKDPSYTIITFIVLDGNSGLNTITQAEEFSHAIPLQASILSKYDGSSKGGTIISVMQTLQLPCAFLGTGETYSDLQVFKSKEFLHDFLAQ